MAAGHAVLQRPHAPVQIAHGTLLSERIDVSSEIEDFFRIRESLARE